MILKSLFLKEVAILAKENPRAGKRRKIENKDLELISGSLLEVSVKFNLRKSTVVKPWLTLQ